MNKMIIMMGVGIGSTIGSVIPLLWNGSLLGGMSILLSFVGGIIGIWAGVKLNKVLR